MGVACSTNEAEEDQDIGGCIILRWFWRDRLEWFGLDWYSSR
jgi:hypothetical protein